MIKELLKRGILGFPLGISIGFIITILISLGIGDGNYYPVKSELIISMGGELKAVIFQTALCGILGFGMSMASVIWDFENWSLLKQTSVYFSISSIIMLSVAYWARWMEHSLIGFACYFAMFIVIFILIWFFQYLLWKRKIRKINEMIKQ